MINIKKIFFAIFLISFLLITPVLSTEIIYTMPESTLGEPDSSIFGIYYTQWEYANITHSIKAEFDGASSYRSICNFSDVPMYDSFDVDIYYTDKIGTGHINYQRYGTLEGCNAGYILFTMNDLNSSSYPYTGVHAVSLTPVGSHVFPHAYATSEYLGDYHAFFGVTYGASGYPTASTTKYTINYDIAPKVDFTYTNLPNPLLVTFTDTSTGFTPVYYGWEFGDGNIYTGIESSVQHLYTSLGTYNVNHVATDFGGIFGWSNKTINLTSISDGGYSLSVSPQTVIYGNPTTVTLSKSGGFNDVNVVSYYTNDTVNFEPFTLFSSFRKNDDGSWSRINISGAPYLPTVTNPFSFSYSPSTYGNKTITAMVYNKTGSYPTQYLALLGSPSTILVVSSPSMQPLVNMYLYAYDVYTGAHLSNVTLTLIDYTLGGVSRTWNNVVYQQNVVLNAYDSCNLSASKDGYTDNYMLFTVPLATGNLDNPLNPPQINQFVGVQLVPDWIASGTNFTIIATAIDSQTNQKIPNFKITIPQLNIVRTSDATGNQLVILVPYDITFSVVASANGYVSQTDNTGSYHPLSLRNMEFKLVKTAITPTPFKPFTTSPTPYETEGGTVINGTTFCEYPRGGMDLRGTFDYYLCISGVTNSDARSLILAMILVLFIGFGVAYLTRDGLGFIAGCVIGFVLSLGFGLIPLWILFTIIAVGILIGVILVWKG